MLRYSLDDLGWHEFESLVQALLKLKLGLGVEAWGRSGDWGRDAYFESSLTYPTTEKSPGPFVFQCKFISGANAAGANSQTAVDKAVVKECKRLDASPHNQMVRHYVLLTNAPIGANARQRLVGKIRATLQGCEPHIHDGSDIWPG